MDKKRKSKTASDENPNQDENRPVKKKKKPKQANNSAMILIAAGTAVFLVLVCAVGVSAFFWWPAQNGQGKQQAQVDPNKDNNGARIIPGIENGPPGKKGGKGIVQNVQGAVYRTERKSELKNIGLYYIQFCDEYKGGARTYDNFLSSMKREFGPIHAAIKDGYYQMNMKANLQRGDIIAYERDEDTQGHLCVRTNGDISYVPAVQLKQELGIK